MSTYASDIIHRHVQIHTQTCPNPYTNMSKAIHKHVQIHTQTCPNSNHRQAYFSFFSMTVLAPCIGKGWASVLKTHLSSGIRESSEKVRYRYFRASARKKLCCTSSWEGLDWYTSRTPVYPPSTRQCFSRACNVKVTNVSSGGTSVIKSLVVLENLCLQDLEHFLY